MMKKTMIAIATVLVTLEPIGSESPPRRRPPKSYEMNGMIASTSPSRVPGTCKSSR